MLEVIVVEDQLEAAAGRRSEGLLGIVAEVVAVQPATGRGFVGGCSHKAWVGGFDSRAADQRDSRLVLLLRASANAMPASGPSSLLVSLRTRQKEG